jgi:hypothetical protein
MEEEMDAIKKELIKQEHVYKIFHVALLCLTVLGSVAAFVILCIHGDTAKHLWFPVTTGLISALTLMEK